MDARDLAKLSDEDALDALQELADSGLPVRARDARYVIRYLRSDDWELRFLAAQVLGNSREIDAVEDVRAALAHEHNDLVLSELIDTLATTSQDVWYDEIAVLSTHPDELVRSSAMRSLGSIGGERGVRLLMSAESVELSETVLVDNCTALLKRGYSDRLDKNEQLMLSANDYHARCGAANLLSDLVDDMDVEMRASLRDKLFHALEHEDAVAVIDAFYRLLDDLA